MVSSKKIAYKQLRKKLQNKFKVTTKDYSLNGSIGQWVEQCGIKPLAAHTNIICTIYGSVPYCYQEQDRQQILLYLETNKFKQFKKDFL